MGVDYTPVAGYGIVLDEGMLDTLRNNQEYQGCIDGLLFHLNLPYEVFGNEHSDEIHYVLLVSPENPKHLLSEVSDLIYEIKDKLDIELTADDIKFINELCIS